MRHIVTCFMILIGYVSAKADYTAIILEKLDGQTETLVISDKSKITFDGSYMILEDNNDFNYLPIDKLKAYKFDVFPSSGVTSLTTAKEPPFKYNGQTIQFMPMSGLINTADIFKIDGTKILSVRLNDSSITTVNCHDWQTGVYVICINSEAYKLIKP